MENESATVSTGQASDRLITIKYNGTVTIETDTPPPPSQAGVWMSARCGGFITKAKGPKMSYTLPNDKAVTLQVSYQDAKGNAATVDGDVTWESSDESIITVEAAADTMTATMTPADNLGQAQVRATADADLGEGVVEIICVLDVTVVGGQAVVGVITPIGAAHPIADPNAPEVNPLKK
jgi:hypothetical protein